MYLPLTPLPLSPFFFPTCDRKHVILVVLNLAYFNMISSSIDFPVHGTVSLLTAEDHCAPIHYIFFVHSCTAAADA